MGQPAEGLSAADLWPIAKKLPRDEQIELARLLLESEPETREEILAKRREGIGRYADHGSIADDFDDPMTFEGEGRNEKGA